MASKRSLSKNSTGVKEKKQQTKTNEKATVKGILRNFDPKKSFIKLEQPTEVTVKPASCRKRIKFIDDDEPSTVNSGKSFVPKTKEESNAVIEKILLESGVRKPATVAPPKEQQCTVCKFQMETLKNIADSCQCQNLSVNDSFQILSQKIVEAWKNLQEKLQFYQQFSNTVQANFDQITLEKASFEKSLENEKRKVESLENECKSLKRIREEFIDENKQRSQELRIRRDYMSEIENLFNDFSRIQSEYSKRICSIRLAPSVEYGRNFGVPNVSFRGRPTLISGFPSNFPSTTSADFSYVQHFDSQGSPPIVESRRDLVDYSLLPIFDVRQSSSKDRDDNDEVVNIDINDEKHEKQQTNTTVIPTGLLPALKDKKFIIPKLSQKNQSKIQDDFGVPKFCGPILETKISSSSSSSSSLRRDTLVNTDKVNRPLSADSMREFYYANLKK